MCVNKQSMALNTLYNYTLENLCLPADKAVMPANV